MSTWRKENLAGSDGIDAVMSRLHTTTDLAEAVANVDYIYPHRHQFNFARDRFSEADWALQRNYLKRDTH
ncbi:MAG: hypothetical protein E5Y59_24565 [Mesorhizobium sp.]|nr:MAG: hypothetical protein E5Y59_24565 [Mesorhizobium sp.]